MNKAIICRKRRRLNGTIHPPKANSKSQSGKWIPLEKETGEPHQRQQQSLA